ncbi:MAG: histidinol-phosphate transaminase [Planctomycetaceae bacterium]|nr:histidinol-phosphate transaminase [Planctomycetaceae bacterium]
MSLFRPNVDRLAAYVPGEQPQEPGWVKLNTNENPYPPSPLVVEAIERMARARLNVYPDPVGKSFRKAAAELFGLDADWILPANGSDESLTLLVRAFADPTNLIAYPYPSYILYETLAEIQGTRFARLRLNADWSWNLAQNKPLIQQAKLLFVPNPNSPSGNRWSDETILSLVPPNGVLVLDEAYGDFADEPHAMQLLHSEKGSQMVVTRTLSKSYSLAGLRFGFAVAHPDLIRGMRKVKDSYNCDAISLAAAEAAIRDQAWMLENRRKIIATRTRLTQELRGLGFDVVDSQANFVWATRSAKDHQSLYEQLKQRKILVRYMKFSDETQGILDGLRVTVGTDAEVDTFLAAMREIA